MIDRDLMEIKEDIEMLNCKITSAMKQYNRKSFESEHIYAKLESFQSDLESLIHSYSYFEREAKEGQLTLNNRGRYEINGNDLTCGSSLEILTKDEWDLVATWKHGRIEHNSNGYYFSNYDGEDFQLDEGMQARSRR